MTRLVKAATSRGLVQRFVLSDLRVAGPAAADSELEAAEAEIRRLEQALDDARAVAADAEAAAHAAGRREALAEAADVDDRRLEMLEREVAAVRDTLEERLDGAERLAALLARTALAKLVEPSADLSELVVRSIARQMRDVRRETIVAIRVSAADFADEAALAAIAARTGAGPVQLLADPELGRGACRMDLRLGHVDLGVGARWGELSALLLAMAEDEE
jgi:flagellar assembly protein FliH